MLAETFEPSADGLQFAFKLKEGIQFHGGYGEVTAEDVKYSYERIAGLTKPKLDSPYQGDWAALKEVQVTDKYSGTIILKEPFSALMTTTLPVFSGVVHSKKAIEELGEEYATHPISTGPYEFVEWKPKQEVRVQRFADYGGASSDFLGTLWDEIVYIPIDEDNAADIALETGEIDFGSLGLGAVGQFEENSDFTVHDRVTLNYDWIGMNTRNPKLRGHQRPPGDPLRDRRSRHHRGRLRGSLRAGDGDHPAGYADRLLGGRASLRARPRPGESVPVPSDEPAVRARDQVHRGDRLDGDRRDRAGESRRDRHHRHAERSSTRSAYYALDVQELQSRELFYVGFITQPDPSWSTVWFVCDQIDVWNWMYWCDEEYDRLHYAALQESDPAVRNDMYIEMQQLWDAAVHTVWTAWPTCYFAAAQGIEPAIRPDGRVQPTGFRAV